MRSSDWLSVAIHPGSEALPSSLPMVRLTKAATLPRNPLRGSGLAGVRAATNASKGPLTLTAMV